MCVEKTSMYLILKISLKMWAWFFFNVGDMCVKSGRKSFQSLINAS